MQHTAIVVLHSILHWSSFMCRGKHCGASSKIATGIRQYEQVNNLSQRLPKPSLPSSFPVNGRVYSGDGYLSQGYLEVAASWPIGVLSIFAKTTFFFRSAFAFYLRKFVKNQETAERW